MLSKKHVSSQIKKWGFVSCHDNVFDKINKGLINFVKNFSTQRGGRIVMPSEWYGVDSGRYSADASPGSSTAVTDAWIRPPMQANDPTGAIKGGSRQRGGRIVQSSEWYGVDSGRYSADAGAGSSTAVTDAWIRPPMQASDPTGAIVGGASTKFVVTAKALSEAASSAGVVLSQQQKRAAKAALESTLSSLFDSAAKKSKSSDHLSLATFDNVLKQRRFSSLR